MPIWLTLAKGPLARFALALLILGLLRLALMTAVEIILALRRAGDRRLSYRPLLRETLSWLVPLSRLGRARPFYSYASFSFHLGLLAAAFFLGNHLDLLQVHLSLSWRPLAKPLLDGLTLVTIGAGTFLLLHRLYVASSRRLSGLMDYFLLGLILLIFITGFVAGRSWNPLPYHALMLTHTLAGILLLVVIPFTKIAHCILYPLIRLGSEVAWHFPPHAGRKVVEALHGPEGRRV